MRKVSVVFAITLAIFAALPASGQTIRAYLNDMDDALYPYGTLKWSDCHSVTIDLTGPWGNYALPDGISEANPDEYTWSIIRFNFLRFNFNLAGLDEDKVVNHAIYSTAYIHNHPRGAAYTADTPTVLFSVSDRQPKVATTTVDLNKVISDEGYTHVPENQMGTVQEMRSGGMILFFGQAKADAFEKAMEKAIVLCKAQ